MGSKWRKAKLALGLNLCYYVPRTVEDDSPPSSESFSDAALLSHPPARTANWNSLNSHPSTPASPVPAARRRFLKSSSRSSEWTCSICLAAIKHGDGHAIFTAECSHSFHFHCITSNVKYGNQVCPVCRAKWKEIPLQSPKLPPSPGRPRMNPAGWPQNNALMTVIRRLPHPRPNSSWHVMPLFQATEPALFDDDEYLSQHEFPGRDSSNTSDSSSKSTKTIDIRTYPEVLSVPRSKSYEDFTVLIQLKAVVTNSSKNPSGNHSDLPYISQTSRTPVDLVTVLDISGSMAGTKLALLKRAMGFVIQNLSSNDRLSVIAFSSTARRLFPLRRMSETGRQEALQAVNSLMANGGTNIAEGLRKGAKVMEERREKNPVASIILLSDGQDTYTVNGLGGYQPEPKYQLLLPMSIQGSDRLGSQIPVHTFGFGTDHDASSMHSISEASGGTFSFIETEAAIQDAFAQCIGGLLSVVVQELQVGIECAHPTTRLGEVKAGSYPTCVMASGRAGYIRVGDLYADEERDFLISVNVPADSCNETSLLKVRCVFRDPFTKEMVTLEGEEVKISRPETVGQEVVSIEVDRQRNRLRAAEAISQASAAAEQGDLAAAVSVLENCRKTLSETASAKCRDRLCVALDAELKEMQERMASRHVYEASGRAYILSGLSSHSWQRATARGDSTDSASIVQAYQTPSMIEMLSRSQAMLVGSPTTQRVLQPAMVFSLSKPR
ncbi:hypothetical protein Nepgr_001252 [Nepenthes gracilis]|uniref:Uncharacterized protein n=1 Tax=Nepenthes gracilis TaxID=150966 RepID=A0AAD3P4V2_NEPGR|nr:hypothetical protein Nepgr_001252 [Nepenthes gracilis]